MQAFLPVDRSSSQANHDNRARTGSTHPQAIAKIRPSLQKPHPRPQHPRQRLAQILGDQPRPAAADTGARALGARRRRRGRIKSGHALRGVRPVTIAPVSNVTRSRLWPRYGVRLGEDRGASVGARDDRVAALADHHQRVISARAGPPASGGARRAHPPADSKTRRRISPSQKPCGVSTQARAALATPHDHHSV